MDGVKGRSCQGADSRLRAADSSCGMISNVDEMSSQVHVYKTCASCIEFYHRFRSA